MSQEHSVTLHAFILYNPYNTAYNDPFLKVRLQNTNTSEIFFTSWKELILLGLLDYYKISDWKDKKILEVIYYRVVFINITGEHEFFPFPIFPLTETTLSPLYP